MKPLRLLFALFALAVSIVGAHSQVVGKVYPATVPIQMPGERPLSPDQLRLKSPWNLPMTGRWKFKLTHGSVVGSEFVPAVDTEALGISVSSYETANPPLNAFDGKEGTRWCAATGEFPQWIRVDLGRVQNLSGFEASFERAGRYQCRLEDSVDGSHWKLVANQTTPSTSQNGSFPFEPRQARYVKLTILGADPGNWASVREVSIHRNENGADTVWRPETKLPSADSRDEFKDVKFKDKTWDTVSVPSNWEMLGYSIPTYNSVDDTVGLYRRWVTIPRSWAGRRTLWRFDGALDGAEIFVNGQKAGYHESGYTAFDVDLTGLVKPGEQNLFAVRVSKSVPSSDCETGDFQCMGGIYRETSLISVPETHIQDLIIQTDLMNGYRDAKLKAKVKVVGSAGAKVGVVGQVYTIDNRPVGPKFSAQAKLGSDGSAVISNEVNISKPKLWSAEKPNLYYVVVKLTPGSGVAERVEQRFGFRQIEIKNGVLLWNGQPIKCEGTCRHDFWGDKGFALTDKEWNQDLTLMKAANINAIRTSHYNHAARFLELCEERGMYILDEVPFCWINEKNNDPTFAPSLLLRAADTLGRDKNRPCVLAWSLGNENGIGKNSQTVIDFVRAGDATRPAFVGQGGDYGPKGQAFQDMHYPSPEDVDAYAKKTGDKLPALFSEQPHIFYQKEWHDYDPGVADLWSKALGRTWDKIWPNPNILGSFIWEWQNQGIADKNKDRTQEFYYGKDRLRQENNKGIVTSMRDPKAEYWIVKMTYCPIRFESPKLFSHAANYTVTLTNRYSFTDLKELHCKWTVSKQRTVLGSGVTRVACAPGKTVDMAIPSAEGGDFLYVEFDRPDGTKVGVCGFDVRNLPHDFPPVHIDTVEGRVTSDWIAVTSKLGLFEVDRRTGAIKWSYQTHPILDGGPVVNLGEGLKSQEKEFYRAATAPKLDMTFARYEEDQVAGSRIVTQGDVKGEAGALLGTLDCTYTFVDGGIKVDWKLNWKAATTHLWEAGLKFKANSSLTKMVWNRDSFFTEYPRDHLGAPQGMALVGSDLFRSTKRSLWWMTLFGEDDFGLRIVRFYTYLNARVSPQPGGMDLYVGIGPAGPRDFSGAWVRDFDIVAEKGKSLSGRFEFLPVHP